MSFLKNRKTMGTLAGAGVIVLVLLAYFVHPIYLGMGVVGLGFFAHRRSWIARVLQRVRSDSTEESKESLVPVGRQRPRRRDAGSNDLVEEMLEQGRYALLLRPQVIDNLNNLQLRQTVSELQEHMALVPAGQVVMGHSEGALEDGKLCEEELQRDQGRVVDLEPVFLDRYTVTNLQFQTFVDNGGYEEMAIWDEEVLPAMLDFVDRTGHPAPRLWKDGHFEQGKENHPVVGISWYEAAAYARWNGKRLPTDAEWCKAACWPVSIGPRNWQQRKFPWGNSYEDHRANTWTSGHDGTVPVTEYAGGVSVGGAYQLIGNVWEWSSVAFGNPQESMIALPVPMKSIRGGAYDSYFENQATCQFESGENPLSRKHNIGFRLGLGACDLAPRAAELLLSGVDLQEEPATAVEVSA